MVTVEEKPIDVLAFAVMVGGDVYELETSAENAKQEAQKTGGRVVELIDRAAVIKLIELSAMMREASRRIADGTFDAEALDHLIENIATEHGEMLADGGPYSGYVFSSEALTEFTRAILASVHSTLPEIHCEARECESCGHSGINDAHILHAACHSCDWSGPEPEDDQCPGCAKAGVMTAACPRCEGRYRLITEGRIAVPFGATEPLAALFAAAPALLSRVIQQSDRARPVPDA